MFTDELTATGDTLEAVARDWEPGSDSEEVMAELGRIRRCTDVLTARALQHIADTQSFVVHGDRSAAEFCGRVLGVGSDEAKRVLATANRLESLPETEAAFRAGQLSAQQVALIAETAVRNPALETELLEHAG
ncbi:MAG: hypothetical protein JWL73_3265, partial [Actinomycetia bacterium]|nr:hypothetical protein [Actinomycetes bacterium]